MPVAYPLVNGNRYDFTSVVLKIAGAQRTVGIKSITYKSKLSPGKVRGTSAQLIGRTRGEYEADGAIEMYREDWDDILKLLSSLTGTTSGASPTGLAPGFMEVSWDASVSYAETPASPVQTDGLLGCRITEADASNSQGSDALTVKLSLDILMINHNGAFPVNIPLGFGG